MILTTKEIINIQYGNEHLGSSGFDKNKKWVSVDYMINELKEIVYLLHHDSSFCWEDLADDLIKKLEEKKK